MCNKNPPLVSFCVKSYNQRCYLAQALEGAWSQTYRPLEIIVSDDGSTDGSWEYIQAFAAAHPLPEGVTLVLNRNEQNLGNLGNWEKCCELSHGILLVKADGDDISLPERTSVIVEAWLRDGGKAMVVCHTGYQIGPKGEHLGRLRPVTVNWALGAAMAYSAELFKRFPRIGVEYFRCMDDEVYTRRARMLGTDIELSDRLVKYRFGAGATSSLWNIRKQILFCNRDGLKSLEISECDRMTLDEQGQSIWRKLLDDEKRVRLLKIGQVSEKNFVARYRIMKQLRSVTPILSIPNYIRLSFLMPRPLSDVMLLFYLFLRNTYWRLQPK